MTTEAQKNLPAIKTPDVVEIPTGPPKADEWASMKEAVQYLIKAGYAPRALNNDENKVLAIVLKGREIGVSVWTALDGIHIIDGKPTISANLMRHLIYRAGHHMWIPVNTNDRCVVKALRKGEPADRVSTFEFTMADAKRAGISGKGTWNKYPARMLEARATSAACRAVFADALGGVNYTPEELGDDQHVEAELIYEGGELVSQQGEVTYPEDERTGPPEPLLSTEEEDDADPADGEEIDVTEDEVTAVVESWGESDDNLSTVCGLSLEIWGDEQAFLEEIPQLSRKGVTFDMVRGFNDAQYRALISGMERTASKKRKANQEARERGGGDSPEEARREYTSDDDGDRPPSVTDPDDVEGVEKGGASTTIQNKSMTNANKQATKKQLNYLEALIGEYLEDRDDPIGFFCQEAGIHELEDLSRQAASDWIERLAGRES